MSLLAIQGRREIVGNERKVVAVTHQLRAGGRKLRHTVGAANGAHDDDEIAIRKSTSRRLRKPHPNLPPFEPCRRRLAS
jgi:hypothetical protein